MDVTPQHLDLRDWTQVIDGALGSGSTDPITNLQNEPETYDAVFVGGGASGRFGASFLQAMGGRALIVDSWPFLGGSCPHQACVPHHLFSEVAAELDRARWMSGRFGFAEWDPERASILEIVELFRSGRASAHAFMNWQTKEQLDVDYVLNAGARVVDAHTVAVPALDRHFDTRTIVLAMGAHPTKPEVPGVDLEGVFDFATLVEDLDYEPSRCVVIGGSKTALEYGAFFHATGCETTIISRSPLMRTDSLEHIDEDLRTYVVDGMRTRGMQLLENARPLRIVDDANGRVAGVVAERDDGGTVELDTDFVFLGTGERPNSGPPADWLGVETGPRGEVVVDARMRTSVPDVYAVGDLIGPPMEMFKARKCGMTAASNIMGEPREFDFSEYPDFLHTTYEVTWVGLTEEEARDRHDDVVVIRMPPEGVDHGDVPLPCAEGTMLYAFAKPELSGFQKAVIDAGTRRVVGLHHVGYGAKDAFQYLDHLMRQPGGLTVDDLASMNELFLNPEHFIQLSRLRAGKKQLVDL